MNFFSMGSLHNTVKTKALQVAWKQKKESPQLGKPTDDKQNVQIKRMREDLERIRKGNITSSIDSKLKSGASLTSDELQYLKENNPELYQEAIEIKREREAYEKKLKSCRTKEDVEKVKASQLQTHMSTMKSIMSNPNIPKGEKTRQMEKLLRKVMGIFNEHTKFLNSPEYEELPKETELDEEEKSKRKKHPKPSSGEEEVSSENDYLNDVWRELAKALDNGSPEKETTDEFAQEISAAANENTSYTRSGSTTITAAHLPQSEFEAKA